MWLSRHGATDTYDPIDQADTFGPDDEVYIVGSGDFGQFSTVSAEWYVDDKLNEVGTRSFTMDENGEDIGFYFSFVPDGGWPEGNQRVVLKVDGDQLGAYEFSVSPAMAARGRWANAA